MSLPAWVYKLPKAPGVEPCPRHHLDYRVLAVLPECPACAGWLGGDSTNKIGYVLLWRDEVEDITLFRSGLYSFVVESLADVNRTPVITNLPAICVYSVEMPADINFTTYEYGGETYSMSVNTYRILAPGSPRGNDHLVAIDRIDL